MTTAIAQMTKKELREQCKEHREYIKSIRDKGDNATVEEMETTSSRGAEIKTILDRLEQLEGETKSTDEAAGRYDALKAVTNKPGFGGDGGGHDRRGRYLEEYPEVKSIGQQFTESEEYKSWLDRNMPGDARGRRIPDAIRDNSAPFAVKTLYTEAIDRSGFGPLLGQPYREPDIVRQGWNRLVLRNLISNLTTSSDMVETIRENPYTNNAAAVAEATATAGTGVKPESAISYSISRQAVQTIAHHIPATTRVLADATQLRSEIDASLRNGIDDKLERLMLTGSGTDPEFLGINNTTGILVQAYATDLLTTLLTAQTQLEVTGLDYASAWLLNPADWMKIALLQNTQGNYYFGGPLMLGTPMIWGVPVVKSVYQPAGTAILANFKQIRLYDREQTSINVGTSMDDFLRNIVRILAEWRGVFFVRRPHSVVKVALTSGS